MEPQNNTGERTKLFSIYSDLDEEIIKEASRNELYLIGGTAIEIWLNYLKLKGWRKRSDNDLDFLINRASITQLPRFKQYLRDNGLKDITKDVGHSRFESKDVTVDLFLLPKYDAKVLLKPDMYNIATLTEINKKVTSYKVMSPVILFVSKFNRVVHLYRSQNRRERYIKDLKDLVDLLKIIKKLKLESKLNKALPYWYEDYGLVNINLAEDFINGELNQL